jgi:ABC-type multidrug transport system permease subunit
MIFDAIMRSAIADRLGALFLWKFTFAFLRGIVTGWLLASWVCLFRQCENRRINQEKMDSLLVSRSLTG